MQHSRLALKGRFSTALIRVLLRQFCPYSAAACGRVIRLAPRLGGPFGLANTGLCRIFFGCSSSSRNASVSSAPSSISNCNAKPTVYIHTQSCFLFSGNKTLLTFFTISTPRASIASTNGALQLEYIMRSFTEQLYPGIEYTNT